MAKRITVLDVAKRAGVSHTSVSLAMRGSDQISKESRRRILEIVREMNYQPRAAAQLLRAGRTRQIGIIVAAPDAKTVGFDQDFIGPLLGHLIQECSRRELRYVIEFYHHDAESAPPHQVHSGLVDGSLLAGDVGESLRRWFAQRDGYPWVSIAEPADCCVLVDGKQGVLTAAARLAQLGHRRVAYRGGPKRYAIHRTGFEGFRQAVAEYRFVLGRESGWISEFTPAGSAALAKQDLAWAREMLGLAQRPTAFLVHGETIARAVIYAAMEARLKVPEDLSVIGWGSPAAAERTYPHLAAVVNDFAAMSQRAMELLERQIKGDFEKKTCWIRPNLHDGETLSAVASVPSVTSNSATRPRAGRRRT